MATSEEKPQKCPPMPPPSTPHDKNPNAEILCETLQKDKSATAPFDPRFPNTNQARYCYQMYIDYYRCKNIRGEAHESCKFFERNYKSLCPNFWIQHWEDLRENCAFPGIE